MNGQELRDSIIAMDRFWQWRLQTRVQCQPTFIGVGAGRCGTTSLFYYLEAHPEVYMTPVKEVNYFGIRSKQVDPLGLDLTEYLSYFSGASAAGRACIGEMSPAYLDLADSCAEIKAHLPGVKILITLRDPLERFYSQYKHHQADHGYKDLNAYCRDAIAEFERRRRGSYGLEWYLPAKNLSNSLYSAGCARFAKAFKQVHVVMLEQLLADERGVLRRLCAFLGVKHVDVPLQQFNTSESRSGELATVDKAVLAKLTDIMRADAQKLKFADFNRRLWPIFPRVV